ncbi:CorA family divalent cation transporter [Krasilnikoviella flava]|uniref:Magnesium transporter n=1 Tax=Krasilnikoviella flava TaxID=526729 RepID=A0A1T5K660_9MICO|nr:CorA family divalent cation transporter [Krasilnikoviella flava]SKC59113.1 magnesium transporter [Krasilnikoviella flava]
MTDEETPAGAKVWFVGTHGAPVDASDAAHPARWLHAEGKQGFLAAAEELDPALRDRLAGVHAMSREVPKRPVAAVRWLDDDWVAVLTPTVWFTETDRQVHTGELGILVGPELVLTFEAGGAGVHDRALERLRGPGPAHDSGAQRVALAVVLALVGAASEVEVALGDAVADTERIVFDRATADPVQRLYDLKREITEARRALLPMAAELPELTQDGDERRVVADRRTLERVASTVERIDRHLDAHDDLLSDMLQVHLSQVSVRQNEDMRKISAWAAILVYPTVVAGIYGMNFRRMPELHWLLGYPFALLLMAVGCVVLYRVFRRVGWL